MLNDPKCSVNTKHKKQRKITPRHIIIKLLKTGDEEKTLKSGRF